MGERGREWRREEEGSRREEHSRQLGCCSHLMLGAAHEGVHFEEERLLILYIFHHSDLGVTLLRDKRGNCSLAAVFCSRPSTDLPCKEE